MSTDVLVLAGENQALIHTPATAHSGPSLDVLIAAWLHAKLQRSQSQRTADEYAAVLGDFRGEAVHIQPGRARAFRARLEARLFYDAGQNSVKGLGGHSRPVSERLLFAPGGRQRIP